MRVHLIVAMAQNRVIGREGKLPWHIPEDLRRFKRITMGHPVVMGRRTWESIGRALPGRENIVVTRQRGYGAPGAVVVHSLEEALARARGSHASDAFVIGGGELYAQALPLGDVLHLTLVHEDVEGDTRFPPVDARAWRETAREDREDGGRRYSFVTLERA